MSAAWEIFDNNPGDGSILCGGAANNSTDFQVFFVDYNSGNFRLRDDSAVKNLANPANLVLDDFDLDDDGNTTELLSDADLIDRIVGSGPDLGAFEKQTV